LLRSTGSHAHADRQMRRVASPVVATSSGIPMSAQLDERAAEWRPELERGDRDDPQNSTTTER
jgi:hypothetical protein